LFAASAHSPLSIARKIAEGLYLYLP